ncbi:MAG: RMD1 family protein, partial [Hyphomonadaceae bacterium]
MSTPAQPEGAHAMRAYLLANRIETRGLAREALAGVDPIVARVGAAGQAFVFRDGAAVFLDVSAEEERDFLEHLRERLREPFDPPGAEEAILHVRPDADEQGLPDGAIAVKALDAARMAVVADVLGKAAGLNHYEPLIERVLERVEPLAAKLARDGRAGAGLQELSRRMGEALLLEHRLVGRSAVAEKPEILWDHPEFERLYARLEAEYELKDRALILERKLDLLRTTSTFVTELIQNQRAHLLEWAIIWLIVFEIVL